jgi:hypothetical protein
LGIGDRLRFWGLGLVSQVLCLLSRLVFSSSSSLCLVSVSPRFVLSSLLLSCLVLSCLCIVSYRLVLFCVRCVVGLCCLAVVWSGLVLLCPDCFSVSLSLRLFCLLLCFVFLCFPCVFIFVLSSGAFPCHSFIDVWHVSVSAHDRPGPLPVCAARGRAWGRFPFQRFIR